MKRPKNPEEAKSQDQHPGSNMQYQLISVAKIVVTGRNRKSDESVIAMIAEAMEASGLWYPIIVRNLLGRIVLVSGVQRLEAAKRLGWSTIPCFVFKDGGVNAQLVRLGEDLCRKRLTVLRRAEMIVEYYDILISRLNNSGQVVPQRSRGRPLGDLARASVNLSAWGSTLEARRKTIRRAEKINGIDRRAKEAARIAKLDDNQSALLKIAKAIGLEAQLAAIADLTGGSLSFNSQSASVSDKRDSQDRGATTVVRSPPTQPDDEGPEGGERHDDGSRDEITEASALDVFVEQWNLYLRSKWLGLCSDDQGTFCVMLREGKATVCMTNVDFVRQVLCGRERIKLSCLYAFAKKHGFRHKDIRSALKNPNYRRKRKGSEMYVYNRGTGWKDDLRVFADKEILAAFHAVPVKFSNAKMKRLEQHVQRLRMTVD